MSFPKFLCVFLLVGWVCPAYAGGLIRDAEIESTLRDYATPLFKAAGLKPSAIHIYMVQDDSLNAFVAGGQNLFLHTGLIMEMKTPGMLLGVMAHETGHIAGGHLAKGAEKLKDAQLGTIVSMVLGAAAGVASGRPEAAAVVINGAGGAVTRNFLSYSRANENAADQAALGFLDTLGVSASGMVDVFTLLRRQERQHMGKPDPYMLTHPLSGERIDNVQHHVEKSSIPVGNYPKIWDEKHARMVAKLYGFLKPPEQTLRQYPANDMSVAGRMARAVAFFMQVKIEQSMEIMNVLTSEHPKDAFLYDLKGQICFETAQIECAYEAYRSAVKIAPNESLILADLAKVELARATSADVSAAIGHFERSLAIDKDNAAAWHGLAVAYGKQNNNAMLSLSLAEEALLAGDADEAISQSNKALSALAEKSPSHQRADDIKRRALQMKKEQKDVNSPF